MQIVAHWPREPRRVYFFNLLRTDSHNLKLLSKLFHNEIVLYKKVICPVALLKHDLFKGGKFESRD